MARHDDPTPPGGPAPGDAPKSRLLRPATPALVRPRGLDPGRRRALERLALGLGAFGLTGCFDRAKAQVPDAGGGEALDRDVPLLETLVIMEDIAARTYLAAQDLLTPGLRPVAEVFAAHHAEHRDDALAKLAERDAGAPDLVPTLENLPELPSEPSREGDLAILAYALDTERQAVNAYLGLLSQFTAWSLRLRAADILTCETAHFLALRQALAGDYEDPDLVPRAAAVANYAFFTAIPKP